MRNARTYWVLPVGVAAVFALSACTSNTPTASELSTPIPTASSDAPTVTGTPEILPTPVSSPVPLMDPYKKRKIKIISITPNSGKYGVGIPVIVKFNDDVPKRYRDEVETMMTVDVSNPVPDVAWSWTSADTAVLRPKHFWPANTEITVKAELDGSTIINGDKEEKVKFTGGDTIRLKIGRELITKVNGSTSYATVYRNGKKVRTMPISLGKQGWESRNGIKVVHEKYKVKRMTSTAVGDTSEFYELDAPYSTRLTTSGEFLHGAPWAYGRLGRWNGSHGCTNATVEDAKWFYETTLMGDPVISFKTGGNKMEPWNGWGGPWNVKWDEWLSNSYTGAKTLLPLSTVANPVAQTQETSSLSTTSQNPLPIPAASPSTALP